MGNPYEVKLKKNQHRTTSASRMTTYTGNGIRTITQKEGADNSRTVKCINCNAETGTGTGRVARTRKQEFEANNFHTFKFERTINVPVRGISVTNF